MMQMRLERGATQMESLSPTPTGLAVLRGLSALSTGRTVFSSIRNAECATKSVIRAKHGLSANKTLEPKTQIGRHRKETFLAELNPVAEIAVSRGTDRRTDDHLEIGGKCSGEIFE